MALNFLNNGYFAGKVGIGTESPTATLHVESADDALLRLKSTDNKAYIALSDNDTNGYISSENSKLSLGANTGVNANNLNIDLEPTVDILKHLGDNKKNQILITLLPK